MTQSPEERHRNAKLGARVRWSKVYQRRMRRLLKIEEQARDAFTRTMAALQQLNPQEREELERQARRAFVAFFDLFQLDGHELPEDERAYIAGVVDVLAGRVSPPAAPGTTES